MHGKLGSSMTAASNLESYDKQSKKPAIEHAGNDDGRQLNCDNGQGHSTAEESCEFTKRKSV